MKLLAFLALLLCPLSAVGQGTQNVKGTSGYGPPSATDPIAQYGPGTQFTDLNTSTLYVCTAVTTVNGTSSCTWTQVGGGAPSGPAGGALQAPTGTTSSFPNPVAANERIDVSSYSGADWCAKLQAADTALGTNPAHFYLPSSIAGACAGTLTFVYNGTGAARVIEFGLGTFTGSLAILPNNGATPFPLQAPFRFTGQASSYTTGSKLASGGSFLNLTNNAAVAKIETLGEALLEIDHLNLIDTSSDCATFVFTTQTVVNAHDNAIIGTTAAPSACNDAFIFGGTGSAYTNTTASAFGGYGTKLRDNYFGNIKRVALLQSFANNIQIVDNTVDLSSGYSTGGAIEFNAITAAPSNANYIAGNLIETTNYKYFANFLSHGIGNIFVGNGLWDRSATTTAYYNFDSTSTLNSIISSYGPDNVTPLVAGAGAALQWSQGYDGVLNIANFQGTDFSEIVYSALTTQLVTRYEHTTGSLCNSANSTGEFHIRQAADIACFGAKISVLSEPLQAKGTQSVSGCTLSSALGGSWAGSFLSGTTGTCTVTITPGAAAPNGYQCDSRDLTTPADSIPQTAYSTTTCTISGTTVSGDLVTWKATAF